ncbi:hypothetical protein [Salidesulfovibrio brasiliensis]|uniref:hypothetical protein n=1 Tax=Salidesulfovibrio brasiliensis TaxID=221711 RepID=UPI0006CF9814|nr:hypothetical protein [Salidesulfovibrio brasiliensis]
MWRLNNLYSITDKQGRIRRFRMNWAQRRFMAALWYRNIILKARQLGFTTLMCLVALDMCLFNKNVRAGIIAHNKDDAKAFFRDKIKFAYRELPEVFRHAVPVATENANELLFSNNSSIRVATSFRGGTIHFLHVSEYGKICAKLPDRAKEIRTGAFEAVPEYGILSIESTAEGQTGDFFERCKRSQDLAKSGRELGRLDYRFNFYPWFEHPEYQTDPNHALILPQHDEYFERLEKTLGITLSKAQRAWYAAKEADQQEDMKREYPSTPEEAFEAAVEGAYYSRQFATIRDRRQIARVPYDPALPVYTAWDLGMSDSTAIWFIQPLMDREFRVIDFYENSGEGLEHYVAELNRKPYVYAGHYAPHDIRVRELGTGKSRLETARKLGLRFDISPDIPVQDGINAVRNLLPKCWFDETRTDQGVKCLEAYRKDWDERNGCWRNQPVHDWTSHGADAFRYFAVGYKPRRSGAGMQTRCEN